MSGIDQEIWKSAMRLRERGKMNKYREAFHLGILKPVGGLVGDFDNCMICFIPITKTVKYNRNISGKSDD